MSAILWGINAQLSVREARRFKALWPLVRCQDGNIAVTGGEGWNCETREEIAWYSEEQALGFATRLQTEPPMVVVKPGELIAIAGPDLLRALADLKFMPEVENWPTTQDGFRVKPCTRSEYERRALRLANRAIFEFDEAVLAGGLKAVTISMRSALTVLLSTAKRPLEQTKRFFYYYALSDIDAWRDALLLEASSRNLTAPDLKAIVSDYPEYLAGEMVARQAGDARVGEQDAGSLREYFSVRPN